MIFTLTFIKSANGSTKNYTLFYCCKIEKIELAVKYSPKHTIKNDYKTTVMLIICKFNK